MASRTFMYVRSAPSPLGPQYYVATNGNNANLGTISQPWKDIGYGAPRMTPGDTLNVRVGSYAEHLDYGSIISGTAGNLITIQAYNSEVVTMAPVSGSVGNVLGLHCDYVVLRGLILDAAGLTNTPGTVIALPMANSNHCLIDTCEVINASGSGIAPGGASNNIFLNCLVHGNGLLGTNQHHGIYITGSSPFGDGDSTDNQIIGGRYYDNAGFNIHVYYGSALHNLNRTTVRGVRIYKSGFKNGVQNSVTSVAGLLITDCANGLAYDNLVYDNLGVGIMSAFGNGSSLLGLYNNTLYNNGTFDTQEAIQLGAACSDATVQNSIVYLNGGTITDAGSGNTKNHNPTGDPGFANPGGGNFHISAAGPAYQTGVDKSNIFTTDFDGATWVAPWDCGALKA